MFRDLDLLYIFGPALLLASILLALIAIRRNKKDAPELSKAIDHFKITSIVFGGLLVILWISLPSTPSLKTFGYPQDVSQINGERAILKLLQDYNKAIVRTTEVLQWFLFLFIWWFLTTLLGIVKAYKKESDKAFAQQ